MKALTHSRPHKRRNVSEENITGQGNNSGVGVVEVVLHLLQWIVIVQPPNRRSAHQTRGEVQRRSLGLSKPLLSEGEVEGKDHAEEGGPVIQRGPEVILPHRATLRADNTVRAQPSKQEIKQTTVDVPNKIDQNA